MFIYTNLIEKDNRLHDYDSIVVGGMSSLFVQSMPTFVTWTPACGKVDSIQRLIKYVIALPNVLDFIRVL